VKTKAEKRNQARKMAESVKASKKAARLAKGSPMTNAASRKGKSMVPQSKTPKKR